MLSNHDRPQISLPRSWTGHVKSAVLHVVSSAHHSIAYTRGWAADSINTRVRLTTEKSRLQERVAQLEEELRIKDARSKRVGYWAATASAGPSSRASSSTSWIVPVIVKIKAVPARTHPDRQTRRIAAQASELRYLGHL